MGGDSRVVEIRWIIRVSVQVVIYSALPSG